MGGVASLSSLGHSGEQSVTTFINMQVSLTTFMGLLNKRIVLGIYRVLMNYFPSLLLPPSFL